MLFKSEREKYKAVGHELDRLKPEIDYDDDGRMMILYAKNSFEGLTEVNTKRIHYCLNLFDNSIATSLLKTISSGLVLERENGKHNYLSFRTKEPIADKLDSDFLAKPNALSLIQKACNRAVKVQTPTHLAYDSDSLSP